MHDTCSRTPCNMPVSCMQSLITLRRTKPSIARSQASASPPSHLSALSARVVRPCCARTKPTKAPRHQQTVNFNTLSLHDDVYYCHKRQTGCSVRDSNVRHHDIRGGAVYCTQQTRRTAASGTDISAKLTIQIFPVETASIRRPT